MSRFSLCSLALLTPLLAAPALAQGPWSGSIGAGLMMTPDYLGSNDYTSRAVPDIELNYGDFAYLSWRDGLGINLYQQQNWTISPFLGFHVGRDNEGNISAFEKVDAGMTAGVRVSYQPNMWRYSLKAQTPVTGDVSGYKLSLNANLRQQIAPKWHMGITPSLSYSSSSWTQDMFNVSARDSAYSGLRQYQASSGHLRLGLIGSVTYQFTKHWNLTGVAGATQLTGDAKDSPIVKQVGDATQLLTGVAINYSF
ncbi:MipA/OmpV family protein [Oceanisphaera pacifica]|uniref:MipA/OmpV family protein n=1 Tax=Oceanisphaera pacifica TaxID=2818389 RepID=A0ABS3NHN5_9GAMM|nr:MipA/OmpV family protein [Oceanisphaera pacifica]MBO1520104.1 MipA/OmpV family protein [Oceanisphaera pacifica]